MPIFSPNTIEGFLVGLGAALFAAWMILRGPRVVSLLIVKYLRKRRIAWVSLIAVTLCTAMVIVVISVMGGWLRTFRESFHGISGDIIVHGDSPLTGFPHYQEMIDRIEKLDGVKAAVPTIESFGLLNVNNALRVGVQVVGYPFDRIGLVNKFPQSIYTAGNYNRDVADQLEKQASGEKGKKDAVLTEADRQDMRQEAADRRRVAAMIDEHKPWELPFPAEWYVKRYPKVKEPDKRPGMIIGVRVWGGQEDPADQKIHRPDILFNSWAKLTTVAITPGSAIVDAGGNKAERDYWIVGDSKTNLWQIDRANVYVPFETLQADLKMDGGVTYTDDRTGQLVREPARTSDLQIAIKPGVAPQALKAQIKEIVADVLTSHGIPVNEEKDGVLSSLYPVRVETWDESQQDFLNAVEHEKVLVTVLFTIISVVAVFLIFCIFYMIVQEKTRDIGIIKSVGATNANVAGIFLGYGLAIGVVGGGAGLAAGWAIVHWINQLHHLMAKFLGVEVFNAKTYALDSIPNTLNPNEVAVIVSVAVISSVLGALVPSWRAAQMHPVEALRFE